MLLVRPLFAVFVLHALPAAAAGWTIELFGGTAFQVETPLEIEQEGEAELDVDARWETRPLHDAPYYAFRIGRGDAGGRAWELELLHHKLYLRDPPREVQRFEVSHGFNLLSAVRALPRGRAVWRLGAGAVIAHPETTVRGRAAAEEEANLPGGYHLAGAALQGSIGGRWPLGRRLHLAAEAKLSAAWAEVPVAGGEAAVPNLALHALFGLGWSPPVGSKRHSSSPGAGAQLPSPSSDRTSP